MTFPPSTTGTFGTSFAAPSFSSDTTQTTKYNPPPFGVPSFSFSVTPQTFPSSSSFGFPVGSSQPMLHSSQAPASGNSTSSSFPPLTSSSTASFASPFGASSSFSWSSPSFTPSIAASNTLGCSPAPSFGTALGFFPPVSSSSMAPPSASSNSFSFFPQTSSSVSSHPFGFSSSFTSTSTAPAFRCGIKEPGFANSSSSSFVFGQKPTADFSFSPSLQTKSSANLSSASLLSTKKERPTLWSQHGGSRIAPYTVTKMVGEDSTRIFSISGMPVYGAKSHEELRWEDSQLSEDPFANQFPLSRSEPIGNVWSTTPWQSSANNAAVSCPSSSLSAPLTNAVEVPCTHPSFTAVVPILPTAHKCYACTSCGCVKTIDSPFLSQQPLQSGLTEFTDPAAAEAPSTADNIVHVKAPFGVESSKQQSPANHTISSPSSQFGMSNMPAIDKPAPRRSSSFVTARHISKRLGTLHLKICQPRSDGQKVPFFNHEDPEGILRPTNHPIPRKNPKSAFMNATEPTDEAANDHSNVVGKDDSPNEALIRDDDLNNTCIEIGELYVILEKDHLPTNTRLEEEPVVPKLTRSDYYTEPPISELQAKERSEPGFCGQVRGFVIGRHGYGKIEFEGETDVRRLDLDSLVEFNTREVVVYPDSSKKPRVGEGLNKAAVVTLLNVKCMNKATGEVYVGGEQVDKYVEILKRAAQKQGVEFVSYDPVNGEWKFRVDHF